MSVEEDGQATLYVMTFRLTLQLITLQTERMLVKRVRDGTEITKLQTQNAGLTQQDRKHLRKEWVTFRAKTILRTVREKGNEIWKGSV